MDKRKVGRPKSDVKTERMQIRLDAYHMSLLDSMVESSKGTRSSVVRHAIFALAVDSIAGMATEEESRQAKIASKVLTTLAHEGEEAIPAKADVVKEEGEVKATGE